MKKITIFRFLFLFVITLGYSQVQIGSGSNVSQNLPINPANYFTYSQSIYLGSEINAAPGIFTTIKWYFNGVSTLPNSQDLDIYLGLTSKASFDNSFDWISVDDMTLVYSGGLVTDSSAGWKTITFSTPFAYDGTSNIVIATHEKSPGADSGNLNKFSNYELETSRSIGYFSNSINPDPSNPPTDASGSSSFMVNFAPNIIFGNLSQSCLASYNFSISNISSTSATVTWAASPTLPSGGSDFYYSTSNVRPTNSTTPSGSIVSGTSVNLSALTPNTKYYFWNRNNCGSAYSAWSEMSTFKTKCAPIPTFSESFESALAPELPLCWSKILRGPTLSGSAAVKTEINANNANSGTNSVSLYNANSTGNYDIMLVSPNLSSLNTGNYRLKFYAKGTASIDIVTLNSNLSDANTILVSNVATTSTMKQYVVNFNAVSGTDTYIGFRLKTADLYKTIYLDDIQWLLTPPCTDVSDIIVDSATNSEASIQWIGGTGSTSFDVAIGLASDSDPSILPFENSLNNYITVSGLTESTNYKVWVRSNCSGGLGDWIGPVKFRTDCQSVEAFQENFDSSITPNLPQCWSQILRGPGLATNAGVRTIASNSYSQPNALMLNNTTSNGEYDIIAVSPSLSTLSQGLYRMKFYAKGVGSLEIGTLSSISDSAIFTPITEIPTTAAYKEYTVEFNEATTDTHIGIRLLANVSQTSIYIDNVTYELTPLCPDVVEIGVSNIGATSATVSWTGNGEYEWDVAIGNASDTDPSILPIQSVVNDPSLNLADLNPAETYKVWVRSVCGENNGVWIGPVSFITNCFPFTDFSENFNNLTVPNLPTCWNTILRGPLLDPTAKIFTAEGVSFSYPGNGFADESQYLVIGNKSSIQNDYDIILVSPEVTNLGAGTHRLRFKAKTIADPKLDIGTLSSNQPDATFTVLKTLDLTIYDEEYKVDFSSIAGTTDKYIGLRINSINGYKTIKLDDIFWESNPSCADVGEITVAAVTESSAVFSWQVQGTETKWDIAVGPFETTDPSTLAFETSSVNSYEFMNLDPATPYKVWIRANCISETGAWIGPVDFSTDCLIVESFNEGFNETPYPLIPPCWNTIMRNEAPESGIANTLDYPAAAHSKPGYMTVYGSYSSSLADLILIAPRVSTLNQAANYTLSFWAAGSDYIEIGTVRNTSSTAVFTKITEVKPNDNMKYYTADLSAYTGDEQYIAFRLQTGIFPSNQWFSIDDVIWEAKLGTNDFDLNQLTYFPNPVKDLLTLTNTTEINTVKVFNMLGQEVLTTDVNSTSGTIDMSGIAKGTYMVKITFQDMVKTFKVIKE